MITLYNDRVAYTDTDRFVTDIDYTEHLTEHDVICIVNNGIARQLTVQVIFDLCKCLNNRCENMIIAT